LVRFCPFLNNSLANKWLDLVLESKVKSEFNEIASLNLIIDCLIFPFLASSFPCSNNTEAKSCFA